MRQSKTTIKELSAQYRSVLKRAFIAGVIAMATANAAHATIAAEDISTINASINMAQSDGNYTTSMGDYNVATTDYSTEAGYGQYTYDHDNSPETPEIALTTNNGSETLDNTVFTYTDNTGATTNLGVNSSGFTTDDFTNAAGILDASDGTTNLTTLEATATSVGLENYQYMANFDNSGNTLTALTADAPELSSFHNDIILANGSTITVNGNDETNKPNIGDYGFTIQLHGDNGTGNFDLVYNELTHSYDYNYTGDVELDATDIANASAQVVSQSANLIADTTLFNDAVTTNTNNYNDTLGHYNTVHGVYESDTNAQSTLDTNYSNYATSFAAAQANQSAAGQNLSDAQSAYADDLAVYNSTATAYNDYENSLGKSIDTKDEAVLTSAQDYADIQVASEATARENADDAIRSDFADADDVVRSEFAAADEGLQNNINAEASARADEDAAIRSEFATADAAIRNDFAAGDAATLARANAYTDQRVDTLEKNVSGGVAAATALSSVAVSNVKRGEVSVGAGYGYYNDQSAVAFGAAMGLTDRWSVNAGAGLATGDKTQMSFRAGTNYKFKLF